MIATIFVTYNGAVTLFAQRLAGFGLKNPPPKGKEKPVIHEGNSNATVK